MGWFKKDKNAATAERVAQMEAEALEEVEEAEVEAPYQCYVQLYPVYSHEDTDTLMFVRVNISTVEPFYDIPGFSYEVIVSPAMDPEFTRLAIEEAEARTDSAALMPVHDVLRDADTVLGELKTCLHEMAVAGLLVLFRASEEEELRRTKEEEAQVAAHEAAIRAKYNLR